MDHLKHLWIWVVRLVATAAGISIILAVFGFGFDWFLDKEKIAHEKEVAQSNQKNLIIHNRIDNLIHVMGSAKRSLNDYWVLCSHPGIRSQVIMQEVSMRARHLSNNLDGAAEPMLSSLLSATQYQDVVCYRDYIQNLTRFSYPICKMPAAIYPSSCQALLQTNEANCFKSFSLSKDSFEARMDDWASCQGKDIKKRLNKVYKLNLTDKGASVDFDGANTVNMI